MIHPFPINKRESYPRRLVLSLLIWGAVEPVIGLFLHEMGYSLGPRDLFNKWIPQVAFVFPVDDKDLSRPWNRCSVFIIGKQKEESIKEISKWAQGITDHNWFPMVNDNRWKPVIRF